MTYQPPAYPPPPVPSARPTSPWWKRTWFIAVVVGVVCLGIGGAAAGSGKTKTNTKTVAGPTVVHTTTAPAPKASTITMRPTVIKTTATKVKTHTVTYTPPPQNQFDDGMYEVGRDIPAGTYRTDGGDCYYAVLNSPDTSDIADNDNITGPAIAQVRRGQYFQTSGGCTWERRRG